MEPLVDNLPWGAGSANRKDIAYWLPDKHELHVLSLAEHADRIIDTIPNAVIRGMVWSPTARVLAYFPAGARPPGIRVKDLDTEQSRTFSGSFVTVIASPDAKYVTALAAEGVVRFRLSDGKREIVVPAEYPAEASYSRSGAYLGVTVSSPTAAEMAAETSSAAQSSASDDDTPDCTGGAFALLVQRTTGGAPIRVPFPKGFDTVLNFEFSPDDRAVAVTFSLVGCDYPGEAARVYKILLSDLSMVPISPADRLSVEPHWSPDGNFIIYTDYTGSDSPLLAYDQHSGKVSKLTEPGQFGPDHFLAWR